MLAMPHYHAVGDNLLTNGSFDSADAWRVSEGVIVEGGAAVLGALGPGNLTLTQRIAGTPGGVIRVTASASLDGVAAGPMRWQSARIELFGRASGGKWAWDFDNTLPKATGSTPLRRYARVFELPEKYAEFRIEAHLVQGQGIFRIESLEATQVEPHAAVQHVCLGLGLLTGSILLGALILSVPNRLVLGLGLALTLLLFVPAIHDTLRDAAGTLELSALAGAQLFALLEAVTHFVVVSLLAGMVLAGNRLSLIPTLVLLPVAAWHLETLQHLLPDRQLSPLDAGVNNVAAALAAVGWWWHHNTGRAQKPR